MRNTTSKAILLFAIIIGLGSCSSSFDINKDGGMRIVIETSEKDIVSTLAGINAKDPTFQKAMALATERQKESDNDFITLFGKAFEEIGPGEKLAPFFMYEFKDKVDMNGNPILNTTSPNSDVLDLLREECDYANKRSRDILTRRLDSYFGSIGSTYRPIRYNIKEADNPDRIIIELPNDDRIDFSRVSKLIQCTGDMEVWETYNLLNNSDELKIVKQYLKDVNAFLVERNKEYGLYEDDYSTDDNSWDGNFDELFEVAEGGYQDLIQLVTSEEDKDKMQFSKENPIYSKLIPVGYGATIGYAHPKDTAAINRMLVETINLDSRPRNLRLAWTVKPENKFDQEGVLDLVALKASTQGDKPYVLGSEVIADARQGYNQSTNEPEVEIQMSQEGAQVWKLITINNIGNQIAIVIDNYVFTYPVVNSEISNGRFVISGNFTDEEVQDIANVLNSGPLLVPIRILEVVPVEPMKDNK